MRVGIVGAGMAGLGAARRLAKDGHEAVVFEIAERVGGRVCTATHGAYTFDCGATDLAPGNSNLADTMLHELDTSELLTIDKPIYTHASLRVTPSDTARAMGPRYTYLRGNDTLAQLLAEGLDVRPGTGISAMEHRADGTYLMAGEVFDALILTPPVPQCHALLASLGEERPLGNTFYRSSLSVMLGYSRALPDLPYHALLDPEQRHPLVWLCVESTKCPGRAPEGHTAFVAQLGPQYSHSHFATDEDSIIASTVGHLMRLYGAEWAQPEVAHVHRWRFAWPETYAMFDTVNRTHAKVLVASDGVLGARVEFAYEAGIRAAKLLAAQ